jgi:beta-lactamase class A
MSKRRDEPIIQKEKRKISLRLAFLVLILLLMSNVATYYFFSVDRKYQKENIKNKYKLLDPSQGIYDKNDLIVNFQPLRDRLNTYEKNADYDIGIYLEYLPTGANIVVNKDKAMWPASLLKIPVAMAVMKKVELGEWKLTNELVLLAEDKNAEYGTDYTYPVGTRFTIDKLLRETLINSDNTAYFILLRNLEPEELLNVYDHLGLDDIRDRRTDKLSAKRYSIFFRSLFMSSFLAPENSQFILDILDESIHKDFLLSGMPPGTTFTHKIGVQAEKKTFSDSGIVYLPDRPYILTVMIEGKNDKATEAGAKKLMGQISKQAYDYISGYHE